jgi:probable addiction module antidote protein
MTFQRITVSEDQMGGMPCIRGLRMPVATVVGMVAVGLQSAEILAEHPELEEEDISESLRFAADALMKRWLPYRPPSTDRGRHEHPAPGHSQGQSPPPDPPQGVTRTAPFDAAEYLDNEETIAEFLTAALEDPNPEVFLMALRDVAKARGMADLAKASGLGRESLFKALAPGAKPCYETIMKVMRGLGITMLARTSPTQPPAPATKVRA